MTPKPAACFLSVKGNLMSKMLHEYVFDMQLFKKSEFGWVEKQCLQLNIKRLHHGNISMWNLTPSNIYLYSKIMV